MYSYLEKMSTAVFIRVELLCAILRVLFQTPAAAAPTNTSTRTSTPATTTTSAGIGDHITRDVSRARGLTLLHQCACAAGHVSFASSVRNNNRILVGTVYETMSVDAMCISFFSIIYITARIDFMPDNIAFPFLRS